MIYPQRTGNLTTTFCWQRPLVRQYCKLACSRCVTDSCDSIVLSGIPNRYVNSALNGIYKKVPGLYLGGRSVYSYSNFYIYFLQSYLMWAIGLQPNSSSIAMYADTTANTIENIQVYWTLYIGNSIWTTETSIKSYCNDNYDIDPPTPTPNIYSLSLTNLYQESPRCVRRLLSQTCISSNFRCDTSLSNQPDWCDVGLFNNNALIACIVVISITLPFILNIIRNGCGNFIVVISFALSLTILGRFIKVNSDLKNLTYESSFIMICFAIAFQFLFLFFSFIQRILFIKPMRPESFDDNYDNYENYENSQQQPNSIELNSINEGSSPPQ
eukprot:c33881_g1_i1.p1 GENE.c33881_g1_i1~~c33881_g1_i1.p1  ORF type:complete len:355 (-),score=92.49 c33881_g1_i1:47-1027(-)